jgi:hypothetical protein
MTGFRPSRRRTIVLAFLLALPAWMGLASAAPLPGPEEALASVTRLMSMERESAPATLVDAASRGTMPLCTWCETNEVEEERRKARGGFALVAAPAVLDSDHAPIADRLTRSREPELPVRQRLYLRFHALKVPTPVLA